MGTFLSRPRISRVLRVRRGAPRRPGSWGRRTRWGTTAGTAQTCT